MATQYSQPVTAGVPLTVEHGLGEIREPIFITEDGKIGDASYTNVTKDQFTISSTLNGTVYYVGGYDLKLYNEPVKAGVPKVVEHNFGIISAPVFIDKNNQIADADFTDVGLNSFTVTSLVDGTVYYAGGYDLSVTVDRVKATLNNTVLSDEKILYSIQDAEKFLNIMFASVTIDADLLMTVKKWYTAHLCRISERELASEGFGNTSASYAKYEGSFLQKAIDFDISGTLHKYYANRRNKKSVGVAVGF